MIQMPSSLPISRAAAVRAAKQRAKAMLRGTAQLAGRSPALRKFLVQTIKRVPSLDRRLRVAMNSIAAAATRRAAGPGSLSPAGRIAFSRLRRASGSKSNEGMHAHRH